MKRKDSPAHEPVAKRLRSRGKTLDPLRRLLDEWILPELIDVVDSYLREQKTTNEETLIRDGALLFLSDTPKLWWIQLACMYGQLDLVVRLYEAFPAHKHWVADPKNRNMVATPKSADAMFWAAREGHLQVVRYLHEVAKVRRSNFAMDWASMNGHIEVVRYLHEVVEAPCTASAMNWAAEKGHLPVVRYLHEMVKADCSEWAVTLAAENGHLPVVQYLRETGMFPAQ
jgi:hypothetical protein